MSPVVEERTRKLWLMRDRHRPLRLNLVTSQFHKSIQKKRECFPFQAFHGPNVTNEADHGIYGSEKIKIARLRKRFYFPEAQWIRAKCGKSVSNRSLSIQVSYQKYHRREDSKEWPTSRGITNDPILPSHKQNISSGFSSTQCLCPCGVSFISLITQQESRIFLLFFWLDSNVNDFHSWKAVKKSSKKIHMGLKRTQ